MNDQLAQLAQFPLPDGRRARTDRLKQEALILRDSEGWGAVRIHRELEQRYGQGVISQRAVSKWIAAGATQGLSQSPSEWKRWQPGLTQQDASYLLRLDLVSRGLLGRGLHEEEAKWATRLELALQGLSIFAQWAVIEEYARRHLRSPDPMTDDLDLMLATRPWRDEGLLEQAARRSGIGSYPTIRSLVAPNSVGAQIFEHLTGPLDWIQESSVTGVVPGIARRFFPLIDRSNVGVRILLHICSQLRQAAFIRGPSQSDNEKHWATLTAPDLDSTQEPGDPRRKQNLTEEEWLLIDLFETQRRPTDGQP